MKKNYNIFLLVLMILIAGCEKDSDFGNGLDSNIKADLEITNISNSSIKVIINKNGSSELEYSVLLSADETFKTGTIKTEFDGDYYSSSIGGTISGLKSGTKYYIKTQIKDKIGQIIDGGEVKSFTTTTATKNDINISFDRITNINAYLTVQVVFKGTYKVGYIISKKADFSDSKNIEMGNSTEDDFYKGVLISNLTGNTTYYCKGYIQNSDNSFVYGDVKQFKTTQPSGQNLNFSSTSTILGSYAEFGISCNYSGSYSLGYEISENSSFSNSKIVKLWDRTEPSYGYSTFKITNLKPSTSYYMRAYIVDTTTNLKFYSGNVTFTTKYSDVSIINGGHYITTKYKGYYQFNNNWYDYKFDWKAYFTVTGIEQIESCGIKIGESLLKTTVSSDPSIVITTYSYSSSFSTTYTPYVLTKSGTYVYGETKTISGSYF